MKILFWQWHSFMGKGMERALHRLNIAYDTFFYQMNDWETDDRFAEQLEKRISQQAYDAVISINFNPVISDVCQNHKLPYRAWVYDSPIHIRNVQALKNSYTKVYFFDRGQAEEYQRQGINAGYLPLAADVETFYPVAVTEVDKKEYGAEISLVGKLYQTVYPQYMAPLKEYDRGYLEGVIAAQKKVYGGYFLPDFITDDLIERMNAAYQKQWNGEITVNHREIEFLLASEITRRERQEILTLLSNHFDVALYSGEQNVAIPKIRKKNYIDYYTQMPKVFKCSKVNLNISLKTIRTGIPLRILDILASGGFVISNFQEELAEYFRLGEEIITKNESEKLKKCLKHLTGYGFEIVVVDTGSTDDTVAMAKKYADKVCYFSWCNDFSAARNYALTLASNDIVMMIDSDEYLQEIDTGELENLLKQHPSMVGRIKRINRVSVGEQETEYVERINRIFSRQQYEYSGSIHEQVTAKNKEEYETYLAPVVILHDGYEGTEEERRKKAERNLKLLLKELENHPDDTYFMYQIGKSYYMAEDYEEAIRYFEKALGYDLNPKLEYVIDMVESYGYALLNTGRVETALQFQGIYEEFGDCADFKFLMGLIYMNNERYEEAVAEFLKATEYKSARMTGTNSYLAYYNAGVIRECLGDIGQALEYYRKCGDYAKAQERIRACSKGE